MSPVARGGGGGDAAENGDEPAHHEIQLPTMLFNLIRRGRVRGEVEIELTMVVDLDADLEYVRDRVPQIRSDFLTALTTLARDRIREDQPINPDIVTLFLQPVADRRLGAGQVQLFVRNASVRPL